jgi:hypothetical protein
MDKQQCTKQAAALAGHKLFVDYSGLMSRRFSVEPERFFEMWVGRFIEGSTPEFNAEIWKCFINKLVEERLKKC